MDTRLLLSMRMVQQACGLLIGRDGNGFELRRKLKLYRAVFKYVRWIRCASGPLDKFAPITARS